MQTLLLDQKTWDLCIDLNGNIAVASEPYAQAQDAASSIRTFQGEVYYDTGRGVPFKQQIFGKLPPASLLKAKFVAAALLVPGVVAARCFLTGFADRRVSGQVQIATETGKITATGF